MKRAYSYYQQDEATCPVLPGNMQRDQFVSLVESCAKILGVGRAAMRTFRIMAERTRPQDFKDDYAEPICFMAQTEIAKLSNLDVSNVFRHEAELEAAGLIEKRTLANGGRSGFQGCGIVFSAGIAMVDQLRSHIEHQETLRRDMAKLRGLRSTHKKHITSILIELEDLKTTSPEVKQLEDRFSAWPDHKELHKMQLNALIEHEAEADLLCRDAYQLLQKIEKTHGRECENAIPYIQDTTQETNSVSCNASIEIRTEDKSSDAKFTGSAPNSAAHCSEKSRKAKGAHQSEYLEKLSPKRLYAMASSEMQFYLDARRAGSRGLSAHDFELAAVSRLHEMGINRSAWREACQIMGAPLATICVLITDANRSNPELPVRNPGGYLRGMTRAHQAGDLNIVGGLIGLSERLRADS